MKTPEDYIKEPYSRIIIPANRWGKIKCKTFY